MSMNIYAKEGDKVKPVFKDGKLQHGHDWQKKVAMEYLKEGQIYTVEKTKVEDWSTDVYLKEFPGIPFNSVHFEDALPKKLTPMREAIEKLVKSKYPRPGNLEQRHYNYAIEWVVNDLENLLPKEKEFAKDMFDSGNDLGGLIKFEDAYKKYEP